MDCMVFGAFGLGSMETVYVRQASIGEVCSSDRFPEV